MISQTPAEGILIQKDYGDAKVYTVACECSDGDHAHNVWVEAEETGISVTTYTQQKTKWWELNRWQIIWRLLTTGYVEYEASIIMTKQQALNYASVLQSSIADVEELQRQRKIKQDVINKVASRLAREGDCE